jgi:DNA polymerase sigma
MKLIERTLVPVINVATKDTRAKTLQLDISFDAPNHHGLEAVHMVTQIMDELPMIRPLVIVLKQFLIDRGLLTAYTGGLVRSTMFPWQTHDVSLNSLRLHSRLTASFSW